MAHGFEDAPEAASPSRPGALARRWCEEIFSQGRLDAADELLHPKGVIYGGGLGSQPVRSAAEVKLQAENMRTVCPDLRMSVKELASEGEMVALVCNVSGTHTGEGLGIPPTGNFLEVRGLSMGWWRDGRLLRGWNHFDMMALYQALGLLTLFERFGLPAPRASDADEDRRLPEVAMRPRASHESEANRGLALRWCDEVYNQGRLETLDELFGPGCVIHGGGLAGHPIRSASAFKQQAASMRGGLPDLHMEVTETVADGELVGFRSVFRGTHLGDDMGVPATGRRVEVRGISMGRWRNGLLVEGWNAYDLLHLYRTLGLLRLFESRSEGDVG